MSHNLLTKELTEADASLLSTMHAQAFERRWGEQEFTELLRGGAIGYGLFRESVLLAMLLFRSTSDEAEILTLVTHPDYRRQGLAEKLLVQLMETLAVSGNHSLFLEVREDNLAAQQLYKKYGFTLVGQRPGYYQLADGRVQDALVLRRSLSRDGV